MNIFPILRPMRHWYVLFVVSCVLLFANTTFANLFANQATSNKIASVEEAFAFDFNQKNDLLTLTWSIKPGYYLYQNKISIKALDSQLGDWLLPEGEHHVDEFFGDVSIYRNALVFDVPILATGSEPSIELTFQGCADRGICYPPKTMSLPLKLISLPTENKDGAQNTQLLIEKDKSSSSTLPAIIEEPTRTFPIGWGAFLLGLGVAFTPCVLPMYPMLIGVISGRKKETSTVKMGALVFAYIQGMALSYTLLGIVIALAGLRFQSALQHPVLLGSIGLLFIVLAGSMFGFYSLQMPGALQTKLVQWSNRQKSGSFIGVFFMGAIAGLLCSPCTTAPLSAILLYIAKTGDISLGGSALYLYAIGMGIPLMLFALFGHKLMPKSGLWMQYVKEAFGFVILALPIFLLERFISIQLSEFLWSLLLSAFLIWAWLIASKSQSGKGRLSQITLFILLLIGSYPMQQTGWYFFTQKTGFFLSTENRVSQNHTLSFVEVDSLESLEQLLTKNKAAGKRVLIDYYADWCTACRQFEKYTFTDERVQLQLSQWELLRVDATTMDSGSSQLLARFEVVGLPTLILLNENGAEMTRINGFLDADEFLLKLK